MGGPEGKTIHLNIISIISIADYKELWSLREENQRLSVTNQILKDELINIFDKLVNPENSRNEAMRIRGEYLRMSDGLYKTK
ncbi:MAG: hypothetical protein J1E16_01300 [Muribaculaceae bacterium]|nr:hypothetical protein [Muribaculaceae bacterium]